MTPLGGGSLSEVFAVWLADGREVVVKLAPGAEAEARMLAAIGAAGCAAPEVLSAEDGILVMSRLEAGGAGDARSWREAGAAVARLHAARGAGYGWPEDHAFGDVAIPNGAAEDWPGFWGARRLMAAPEALPVEVARRLEKLCRALPGRLPATPPPALLHGDLWSGNVLFGPEGFSGVIDPACYHGDGEVDLAMLTLFGRPPAAFFEGYGALPPGWEARRTIYQLWPALVHLRLFGAGYRGMVERLLDAAGV
ncbi:fructosamine kinase family protein [Rhodophyticola sp. MJ-SS7]|nr:fructosamine kinase family protein [Rhodophyticola sp. MJ-SS7]